MGLLIALRDCNFACPESGGESSPRKDSEVECGDGIMNPTKNAGVPSVFGNPGAASQLLPGNNQIQFASHAQNQPHFPSSESQAQALAQAQYAQAQAQAAYVQFQAQLQGQGSSNVSIVSPPVLTPSSASAKRASQKPPSKAPTSSNANVGSPLKTMELAPAARRKKRKFPEKQIPEKIAALLPESALYTRLVDLEARVDAALARKKMDMQEYNKSPLHFQKTLRVYVFNTFSNQNQLDGESTSSSESPSWTLKIIGRIVEDGADCSNSAGPKFSSFFKRITIYLDQSLYPDKNVILWENTRSATLHEGFEVKRKGDKEFTAVIKLEMNYAVEKFQLSATLSRVLGIEVETRARVITALWHYVKFKKLQDPNDPAVFACDLPLQKVFGEEKIKFTAAAQKLSQHLSPFQPIHLEHRIKLSGNCPSGNTCYDVTVDVPFPFEKEMFPFVASTEKHGEIDAYDEAIAAAMKKIDEHRRRRAFFLGFSESPAEFINTLIASQSRDLKVVAGDAVRNAEKESHSAFFNQSWVEDAAIQYLNRKSGAGLDATKGK
ncbi:hypothetical protein Nepgr_018577 [Nepenthes gracilis]|uniref:DM2 domain-containing protein n=1 Tax=Nepenthes gracilis TaxID=150966 RepID=A0AAD3STW6_NEPGR|nr:hypothetical protein Nepgr_018577 [Nepenthes gracilis]